MSDLVGNPEDRFSLNEAPIHDCEVGIVKILSLESLSEALLISNIDCRNIFVNSCKIFIFE